MNRCHRIHCLTSYRTRLAVTVCWVHPVDKTRVQKLYSSWRMPSSAVWGRVVLVRTEVSKELIASIITVERFSDLRTTFAACFSCSLLLTFFLALCFFPPWWWKRYITPKLWFLQESRGVTSHKMAFFIVSAARTSVLHHFSWNNWMKRERTQRTSAPFHILSNPLLIITCSLDTAQF
jgi:hypothetical protein